MNKNSSILIIGAGSIGERHIRNLWQLGYKNLIVYRQRNLPFRDIGDAKVKVELIWENIVAFNPIVAFICTPTSQHLIECLSCLKLGMHVFVEKPLSNNINNLDVLAEYANDYNRYVHVGFMMRFHPHIIKIKKLIEENTYGKMISSASHWGSYLPDWHPWENYKLSYAANKELGGGVALTLCHDIDLAIWLADSEIVDAKTSIKYDKALDINAESIADVSLQFINGVNSSVHLNYLDNPPIRTYNYAFENVIVDFDYFNNEVKITSLTGEEIKKDIIENFDRNMLFVAEVESFFNIINQNEHFATLSKQQIEESEIIIKLCSDDN